MNTQLSDGGRILDQDRHLTLRGVSLERIRIDRCLREALTNGADPLHLAALFGLPPTTAMRYAISARRILDG